MDVSGAGYLVIFLKIYTEYQKLRIMPEILKYIMH